MAIFNLSPQVDAVPWRNGAAALIEPDAGFVKRQPHDIRRAAVDFCTHVHIRQTRPGGVD